jgi:dienelactone hydrolase
LDFTEFYRSRQIRAYAASRQLALILAMHCRSKEIEDMDVDPTRGIGRALFTALAQLADSESRPELNSAPLIAMGWSGAGSLVGRLAAFRPERYLAGIAYEPGQYDPLGMDTITLRGDAIRKPQLIIVGGADDHVGTERPYSYFRKYFDLGAPWTFVIQNRTPHCCLQNAQGLILDWLDDVLVTKQDPIPNGLFGYLAVEQSQTKDGWHNATFNATGARVGRKVCQPRPKELCAGWLPSLSFAENWLQFVRRPTPLATWTP